MAVPTVQDLLHALARFPSGAKVVVHTGDGQQEIEPGCDYVIDRVVIDPPSGLVQVWLP